MDEGNIWISKVRQIMNNYDNNNPTINSVLFMLNSMTKEYEEYKKVGTVEEFRRLKNSYTTEQEAKE